MARRKRSRSVEIGEDDVEIESASSSLRQSFTKRPRTALAQEDGDSVVSDDEEDGGEGQTTLVTDGDPDSQSEEMDEGDIDELQATQFLEKKMRQFRDNVAADEGIIEEVFCRNFMCHSKLRVKLGPLINFIIGHNGSGKSAVLTALTLCLGVKATHTNRGSNLKSLIKEGQDNATLAVKIKNQGDNAYKPTLYGRSITVERHFNRAGTSGFKLKNAEDKIISAKKADLDDLLDFFAFQLDNPISVLTQDQARQFLSNSSPSDKYKFFIRGTQLDTLDHDYQLMEEQLNHMESKLAAREEDIAILKRHMEDAHEKKERSERSKTLEDKIVQLECYHAWVQVEEQETDLAKRRQNVEKAKQRLQAAREEAEDASGAYEGRDQAYQAGLTTITTLEQQAEPLRAKHDSVKEEFKEKTAKIKGLMAEARQMKSAHETADARIKELQSEIAGENQRLADAEGNDHVWRLGKLEELKVAVGSVNQARAAHNSEQAGLMRNKDIAANESTKARAALEEKKSDVGRAQARLQDAKSSEPRKYAGNRRNMDILVKAVEKETRWRSKPVGPMSEHVTLLKQMWWSQIEKTFGLNLDGFVVTCKQDQSMLSELGRRLNCRVPILIGHPAPLNTNGKEPSPEVDTILRVLQIDSDLVRNQMIINQSIEQTVLIAERESANIFSRDSGPNDNVKAVLCINQREPLRGFRYEKSRAGQPKSTPIHPWEGQARMKIDNGDRLKMLEDNVRLAQEVFQSAQRDFQKSVAAEKAASQALHRFKQRQRELTEEAQKAEDEVEALQNEIDSRLPQDGKLQELERQLEEAREEMTTVQNSFGDYEKDKALLDRENKELKARMDASGLELEKTKKRLGKAQENLQAVSATRLAALSDKNRAIGMIEKAEATVKQIERDCEAQESTVKEFVEAATQIHPRMEIPKGLDQPQIDRMIAKLKVEIENAKRACGGSREQLTLAYQRARQEHIEAQTGLQGMLRLARVGPLLIARFVAAQLTKTTDHENYTQCTTLALAHVSETHFHESMPPIPVPSERAAIQRQSFAGSQEQGARHQSRAGYGSGFGRGTGHQNSERW